MDEKYRSCGLLVVVDHNMQCNLVDSKDRVAMINDHNTVHGISYAHYEKKLSS